MRRIILGAVLIISGFSVTLPARADFHEIVRAIEVKGKVRHTWIPFFWLGRMVVRMHAIEGVSDIQLATFGKNRLSTPDLDAIVRGNHDDRWQPIVVATSRKDREQTYIYSRADGETMQLLVVARDDEETTVVQLRVDPARFLETVRHPDGARDRFSF